MAKPTEDQEDEEGDEWEGTLKRLTRVVERQARATQEMLGSKTAKLEQIIEDSAARESSQNRLFRAQTEQQMQFQIQKVNEKIEAVQEKIEGKIDAVLAAIRSRDD